MNRAIHIMIPDGYGVYARKQEIGIDKAAALLSPRRQRRLSQAQRKGDYAELTKHVVVCPYCRWEQPAYPAFLEKGNGDIDRFSLYHQYPRVIPYERICKWATDQLSFFCMPEAKLFFQKPATLQGKYVCKKCGKVSHPMTSVRNAWICRKKKRIEVVCENVDRASVEAVVFNLRRGRVYIESRDRSGIVSSVTDVTCCPDRLEESRVYADMRADARLFKIVSRMFRDIHGGAVFHTGECIFAEKLIAMTQFVGFPRSFYDAIPYKRDSYEIDESFLPLVRRLHTGKSAQLLLEGSALPDIRSVRKLYFTNPGLLFYLSEGEQLWKLLDDANLFCRILKSDNVYDILSDMHERPNLIVFLKDYHAFKGGSLFTKTVTHYWNTLRGMAIHYCSLSEHMRAHTRKSWNAKCVELDLYDSRPVFSRPMHITEDGIRDCEVDGFYFYWLRTAKDYMRAGRALCNCLSEWRVSDSPVICVRKNDDVVAAIEMKDGAVTQVRGFGNEPISNVPLLEEAYGRWREKYGIREELYWEFDDADDMPF